MPRAEAGTRAGLPSFERWSFDLAPFTNCLQNWELDNFLVFHLFLVAVLSGLHLFLCLFTYIWCSFPLRADWPKLTALSTGSHRGTRGRIQITEMWLQALLSFRPAVRVPRESLLTSNGDQRTLRLLCRILRLKFDSLTIFCADMEPLSKYSPVMLQFSLATVILTENPGVGCWWSEMLTYLFKVYVLTIFFIKISI